MSEGTFAGTRGNDDNAPTPDLRATAPERGGSTPFWTSAQRVLMRYREPAVDRHDNKVIPFPGLH